MPTDGGKPTCARCTDGLRVVNGQCKLVPNYNAFCRYVGESCWFCKENHELVNGTCVPLTGLPNCGVVARIDNEIKCRSCQPGGWVAAPSALGSAQPERSPTALLCCMSRPADPAWAHLSDCIRLASVPQAAPPVGVPPLDGCAPCPPPAARLWPQAGP